MKKTRSYDDSMHVCGRVWDYVIMCALLLIPVAISVYFDAHPSPSAVFAGIIKVAPLFYAAAVLEIVAYTPLLGTGGMYLSFTTGNISNLKLPCALNAIESAKVENGSDAAEVITTIAIATSSIVTTLILAVFVLPLRSLLPYLTDENSVFYPAIRQVIPALFGALGASYFIKHWKISILPIAVLTIVLVFFGTLSSGDMVIVGVIISMLGAHLMFKKKLV